MTSITEVKAELFEAPSGNVRGTVTASMTLKGKQKRFAHAYLLVDEAPSLTIEVPKTVPLEQLDALADGLKLFAEKVRENC